MRIVILANNIDEVGGAQRVVHTLAAGLGRTHTVDLVGITPHPTRHSYGSAGSYSEHRLMDDVWPARGDDRTSQRRARLRADAVTRLGELLAQGEPGVIIVAQVWAMEVLDDAGWAGWRVFGQYHGAFAAAADGRDLRRILTSYADATAFLALTEEDARAFEMCGLNNVRVMANPIAVWPERAGDLPPVVGYLGRFSPEKGPDLLLDAWAQVAGDFPDWSLRMAGDGPLADQVSRRAAGVPRVQVLPPVADPARYWSETGIGVLPSRTEGFPMSLLEAQAAGVPCVATDCSSGVRVLAPEVLVARDGLAEGLASLMARQGELPVLGARARLAMEQYRLEVILARWEELFAATAR